MLGSPLMILCLLWALSTAGARGVPYVAVVVGDPAGCAGSTVGFEVELTVGLQVFVPTSTLPVWEPVEVGPARAVVRACKTGGDPICRLVVLTPIAERCTLVAPLGVTVFGSKPPRVSSRSLNVYATVVLVALVAVAYYNHVTGTPNL
jgi:hypothetical protein